MVGWDGFVPDNGTVDRTSIAPAGAEVPSSIGRALLVLGDQWTLLILQRAFLGVRRFQDWRDALKISESVLATRLRELVGQGLLVKAPYSAGGRTRQEYRLTDSGLATWRILIAIWQWEKRWVTWHTGLPELIHDDCGQPTMPVLSCAHCGRQVTAYDTEVEQRGAAYDSASPARRHRHRGSGPDPSDPLSFFPETMELLGDRWGTALLAAAFLRLRRFRDFQRELGIPPSVLAERLRRFAELGVFRQDDKDYRLTDKGRAFFDVLVLIVAWGDRYLPGPKGAQLVITHRDCGNRLAPAFTCSRCGEALERSAVHFALGHR